MEHAGYLAYLNIFSLFPLFIILSIVVAQVADEKLSADLIKIIVSYVPNYSSLVTKQIQAIVSGPSVGVVSFASISALWTTTSTLEGMRTIFNKIYKVRHPPFFVRSRLLSILQFLLILIILATIIFSFIIIPKIITIIESVSDAKLPEILNITKYNMGSTTTLVMVFILVSGFYYFLTNQKITIVSVLPGSFLTSLLWVVSVKFMAISLEYQLEQLSFIYGSLSGILILLLFFYVTNVILIYGAEFNHQLRIRLKPKLFRS
jgi:membrane protein